MAPSARALDSVVVSREQLTLSFAIDSSRGAAGIALRYVALAVNDDDLSSPRLMISFNQPSSLQTSATAIQPRECRTLGAHFACADSARANVANGRIVITIRHAPMIVWLFREHPSTMWVRASYAGGHTGYLAVRYAEPLLLPPSREALLREDSAAASEGWSPWTRMLWTSSAAGLDSVWMQVGEEVRAYVGEMQCMPIDSCNYRTDFAASGWLSSDSSVARVTPAENPRRTRATIIALRPGRATVSVEGLHGPSDDLPRSTRERTFKRYITVTNRWAGLRITPRPTTIIAGSAVKLTAQLLDEDGAVIRGVPINFFVIYDWPDNKDWSQKRSDVAARANLTTPGHRRFIAYLGKFADTLDLEVVPRDTR